MKKVIVTALLATGMLLAAKSDKTATTGNLTGNQREALETQSPRVRVGSHHKKHAADRVVSDKKTINAYVSSRK